MALGAAALIGGGSLIGGLFARGNVRQPQPRAASELADETIGLRRRQFPAILEQRAEFDPQFLQANLAQLQGAQGGISTLLQQQINPSLIQQRGQFLGGDINLLERFGPQFREGLRGLSPALAGAQDITGTLQEQALSELQLGRSLSDEEIRESQQAARAATGARGRGAGRFAVGQEILGRNQFATQRQAQRRQFAGGAAQLGLQTSQAAINPFLNILGASRQAAGTGAQQLGISGRLAGQSIREAPLLDPQLLGLESQRLGLESQQAQAQQQRGDAFSNALIGGGLSLLGGGFGGGSSFLSGGGGGLDPNLARARLQLGGGGFQNPQIVGR